MPEIRTKHLWMASWTIERVDAALFDKEQLSQNLSAVIPDDFPNEPVSLYVLPKLRVDLRNDLSVGNWSGIIIHSEDSIVIGSMGFKSTPDERGTIEIGYDIIPAYQGNGYATEMASAMVEWAFQQPGVQKVTAQCLKDNLASIRVLQKTGLHEVSRSDELISWELNR